MNDKTRIHILKGILLVSAGVTMFNVTQAVRIAKQAELLEQENKKLRNAALVAGKIIHRFAEIGPEEICARVMQEYEFEWVVKDLDL